MRRTVNPHGSATNAAHVADAIRQLCKNADLQRRRLTVDERTEIAARAQVAIHALETVAQAVEVKPEEVGQGDIFQLAVVT